MDKTNGYAIRNTDRNEIILDSIRANKNEAIIDFCQATRQNWQTAINHGFECVYIRIEVMRVVSPTL